MTNENPPSGPRHGLRTGRLATFSDGVFAIAITLLVLDIALPASAEAHLLRSVIDLWPSYLAYAASVSTIGGLWLGHVAITEYLERTDIAFVRLNPAAASRHRVPPIPHQAVCAVHRQGQPRARVAATIYGLTLLLATTLLLVLWRYALRNRLVQPGAADEEDQVQRLHLVSPPMTTPAAAVMASDGAPMAA